MYHLSWNVGLGDPRSNKRGAVRNWKFVVHSLNWYWWFNYRELNYYHLVSCLPLTSSQNSRSVKAETFPSASTRWCSTGSSASRRSWEPPKAKSSSSLTRILEFFNQVWFTLEVLLPRFFSSFTCPDAGLGFDSSCPHKFFGEHAALRRARNSY